MHRITEPTIYILTGVAGSGKSTFASQEQFKDYKKISTDDIIDQVAKLEGSTYSAVFQDNIGFATEQMWTRFNLAINNNSNIIFDQTNLSASKRRKILSKVPKNYYKIGVYFQPPKNVLEERWNDREAQGDKVIPKSILNNMVDSFEKPDLSEGFDLVYPGVASEEDN